MDRIDLTCPKCGANLQINEDRTMAHCEYCDFKSLIKKDETTEELAKRLSTLTYARESAKNKATLEYERKSKLNSAIGIFITISIILGSIFFVYKYKESKKIKIDPFNYINITFEGKNTEGIAKRKHK